MSKRYSMRPCARCGGEGFRFRGDRWLCLVHHRLETMRNCSRSTGKAIPTWVQLESMSRVLVDGGMRCFHCLAVMVWTGRPGQPNVVSIQHDRDGTIRFLCKMCNNRHDDFPGDTFYQAPLGHFYCPICEQALPPECFYRSAKGKRRSYCKACKKVINHNAWPAYWQARMIKEKRR